MSRPRKLRNLYHDNGDGTHTLTVDRLDGSSHTTIVDSCFIPVLREMVWWVDRRGPSRVYLRCRYHGRLRYLHRMLSGIDGDGRVVHHRHGTGSHCLRHLDSLTPRQHRQRHPGPSQPQLQEAQP